MSYSKQCEGKRKKIHNLKDLVDSLKQQKLVSDAEQHLLEQNFDGVGKYLFENQIANAKQASKQAICHGCGLWARQYPYLLLC